MPSASQQSHTGVQGRIYSEAGSGPRRDPAKVKLMLLVFECPRLQRNGLLPFLAHFSIKDRLTCLSTVESW